VRVVGHEEGGGRDDVEGGGITKIIHHRDTENTEILYV
jgi:hypothetical protein